MQNIEFKSYNQFIHDLDMYYEENKPNKELIECEEKIINIEKIENITDGRNDFIVENVKYKTMVHLGDKSILFIFLNGSLKGKAPEFNRWSYYNIIKGTTINIADPMYDLYPKLKLGWYYGDKKNNFRKKLAKMVKSVANFLNIPNEKIYIFGSSGGGAATFEVGSYLAGCTCVALNPQIRLADWGNQGEVLEKEVGIYLESDIDHREDSLYYIKNNKLTTHIIIENIRSKSDMFQLCRIKECLGYQLEYGWNQKENNYFWLYDAECDPYVGPHSTQDFRAIFLSLIFLINNNFNLNQIHDFIYLINEFWKTFWIKEKEIRINKMNLALLKKVNKINKKIAVFGAGELSRTFNTQFMDIQYENCLNVNVVFDNNEKLNETVFAGQVKILCPKINEIKWDDYFFIIMVVNNIEEIINQLIENGVKRENYIVYKDLLV